MQPLTFEPLFKRAIWGGRRLATALGKPLGEHADYAESWDIADCGCDQTIVAEGPYRGWPLSRLVAEEGAALLGRDRGLSQFPLLIKFLDANDRLSVQVHPDDERAREMDLGACGKTEAWVVLDANRDSRLYAGLRPHVDRLVLERHLDAGTVEECLHSFRVRRGDCIFVPAGTVHAIGEGLLLVEIQQSSDVTFRLFDWNRLGPHGAPRSLQRDEALRCIDFHRGPLGPVVAKSIAESPVRTEELVRCERFIVNRHTLGAPLVLHADGRFRVLITLAGTVDVRAGDFQKRLNAGSPLLIPAATSGATALSNDGATLLEIHLP